MHARHQPPGGAALTALQVLTLILCVCWCACACALLASHSGHRACTCCWQPQAAHLTEPGLLQSPALQQFSVDSAAAEIEAILAGGLHRLGNPPMVSSPFICELCCSLGPACSPKPRHCATFTEPADQQERFGRSGNPC